MNETQRIVVRRLVDERTRELKGLPVRESVERARCEGATWLGGRCQNLASPGQRYCRYHGGFDD